MNNRPYKDELGIWCYPELPKTMRPAEEDDLLLKNGLPKLGVKFLHWSPSAKLYLASAIRRTTAVYDVERMIRDNVIFVENKNTRK